LVGGGIGGSLGIYVTVHWMLDGVSNFGFEVGGFAGGTTSLSLGTAAVGVSTSAGLSIAVFLGLADEQGDLSKGVSFGFEALGKFSIGVELIFRAEYKAIDQQSVCKPKPDSVSKLLTFPVEIKCIRGFGVSINVGLGVSAAGGLDLNVYTAISASKSVKFLSWSENHEKAVWNGVKQKVAAQVADEQAVDEQEADEQELGEQKVASKKKRVEEKLEQLFIDLENDLEIVHFYQTDFPHSLF